MVFLSLWILFAFYALTNAHSDSSESNESEELIHRYFSDLIAQFQGQNGHPVMQYPHPHHYPFSYPHQYPHPQPHLFPADHNPHVHNHPAYPLPNTPRSLYPQQISMSTQYPNYGVQPNYGGSSSGPINCGPSEHGQPEIPVSLGCGLYRRQPPLLDKQLQLAPVYGTPSAGYAYPNFGVQPLYNGSPYIPHMPVASEYGLYGTHYPAIGMYGGQVPISELSAGQQPITDLNRGQQPVNHVDAIATQRPLPENPPFQEKEDQPTSYTSPTSSNPRTEDEGLMNQPKLQEIDLRSDTGEKDPLNQPKYKEFVYEIVNVNGVREP